MWCKRLVLRWLTQAPTHLGAVQGADVDHIDAEQQVQRLRQDPAPLLPIPGHVQVQRSLHVGQPLGLSGGRDAVGGQHVGGGGLCTCSRLSLQPCSQRSPGVGSWDSGTEPTFTTRRPAVPRTCPGSAGPRQTAATRRGGRLAQSVPRAGRSPRPPLAHGRRAGPGPRTAAARARWDPCSGPRPPPPTSRPQSWS